jgi:site-specific recombinase XerD
MTTPAPLAARAILATIVTRHSIGCPHRESDPKGQHKRCSCWKHLRYFKDGKVVWQTTKQRSWAEAERVKREFEQQHDPATRRTQAAMRRIAIAKARESFLADKSGQNVVPATLKMYTLHLRRLETFLETSGVFYLDDVQPHHLTAFRAAWNQTLASRTRHQLQVHVKTFFKYSTINYDLTRNPAIGLSSIKIQPDPTQPFTPTEYQAMLDAIPQAFPEESPYRLRILAMMKLMRYSGLAIADATQLRRDSLHPNPDGSARIITRRIKTKVQLCVPIPKEVVAALNQVPTQYGRKGKTGDYFFWDGRSAHTVVRIYWAAFAKVFEKGGIVNGHPHRLRDTFAVECLKSGLSLLQVSKLLGHSNISTTEKHYAPWVTELQEQLNRALMATWEKP